VAAEEGLQEQTHRHAYILSLLGIKQLLVVVNKMDLVEFSQEKYEQIKKDITARLKEFGLAPLMVIPIAANLGDNVARRSEKMAWYEGMTLLEGLDQLQPAPSAAEGPLRFPVQDVYELDGEKILVGKMVSGTLRSGQEVMLHPLGKTASVDYIKVLEGKREEAEAGLSIGVVLRDKAAMQGLSRGQVLCDVTPSPRVSNTITATVFWMNGEPLRQNEKIYLKCATQQVECKVKKIRERLNSSTLEILEEDAAQLNETEVGKLTLKTEESICMDAFEQVEELGRFVLIRDTDTVAGGVVH
jgi:sulfate adenylyltransferase subunit 1 (EFTu-like GTPase family)